MRGRFDPLTIYGLAFIVFLYGPLLLLALFSFNDSIIAAFPLKGLTLKAYGAMASNPALHHALWKGLIADEANEDDETLIIRESLQAVQEMDDFTATLLPVGDGLLVAVKA